MRWVGLGWVGLVLIGLSGVDLGLIELGWVRSFDRAKSRWVPLDWVSLAAAQLRMLIWLGAGLAGSLAEVLPQASVTND